MERKSQSCADVCSKRAIWVVIAVFCLFLGACTRETEERVTFGIVSEAPFGGTIINGLKTAMADMDYVEGSHVTYIFDETMEHRTEAVDKEIAKLMTQKVNMLITIGNMPTRRAKQAVMGTNVPVVFAAVTNPVEEMFVESIPNPGGNLTGVQVGASVHKALEWMTMIVPDVRKVFLPYNPEDGISVMFLQELAPSASRMNLEVVAVELRSAQEAVAAIMNLPEEIQAIFRIPSPTLDLESRELSRAAIHRKLPMVACHPIDEDVLLSLYSDNLDIGKSVARMTHQILQGIRPADLPVETTDVSMLINLKTARSIGLNIPDIILHHADRIIR